MADSDNSSYITRFNLISQQMEYFNGSDWYPVPTSGGGSSPNIVQTTYSGSQLLVGSDFSNFQSLTPPFAVTITPSSNTAQILITGFLFMQADLYDGANVPTGRLSVWRDGVNLCPHSWIASIDFYPSPGFSGFQSESVPITWLDTPGDTMPHTYEIKVTAAVDGSEVIFVGASLDNILVAEEVH